jgi:hypothetical protein
VAAAGAEGERGAPPGGQILPTEGILGYSPSLVFTGARKERFEPMTLQQSAAEDFRFGGHQTFPLRIAWLPKAAANPGVLSDVSKAVVRLGLGKNMVEALRCWVDAYGIAERAADGWQLTRDGAAIFGPDGWDPYLEDIQTLWWLHWTISTQGRNRFFAWELLFNRWNEATFSPSAVVSAFAKEAERSGRTLSAVSLKQHFDVWLRTYCAPRGGKLGEEGLDSPLVMLGLIRPAGEREELGHREMSYAFDLGPKRAVSQALFAYCLMAWWEARGQREETASLQDAVTGPGSPGRILRMPESEVRDRLQLLTQGGGVFELREGLNQQQLRRAKQFPPHKRRLGAIYADDSRG